MHSPLEINRAVAIRFVESLSQLDPSVIRAQMTADGQFEVMFVSAGLPLVRKQSVDEFCAQVEVLKEQLFAHGLRHAVTGSTAEADRVAVESVCQAEAPNGRTYRNLYHWLIHVRDGKVVRAQEYTDFLHAKEVFFDE